jgi:type II secretory pathway component GspD/PulD (secretin)
MKRLAALALLFGIFTLNSGTAQPEKPTTAELPKTQRAHFAVKHADPLVLAEVGGAHFKGDATLIAAPPGSGNAVLISGSPAIVPEVVKLLELLDKRPRTVEVEITTVELPVKKDAKELTPADLATVDSLVKDGKGQRVKLTSVEGREATTQIGGNRPFVSGTIQAGGGFAKGGGAPAMKSITYHQVGTTVKLTPRIGANNAVLVALSLQESKIRQPEAGDDVGAPTMESNSLNTKLNILSGRSVIAQSARTETKAGAITTVVIVTAKIVNDDPATSGP